MPQFFETVMGKQFYDGTMPKIAEALERISKFPSMKLEDPIVGFFGSMKTIAWALDDIAKSMVRRDIMVNGMDEVDEVVDRLGHLMVAHGWEVVSSTFAPEDDGDIVLRFRIKKR